MNHLVGFPLLEIVFLGPCVQNRSCMSDSAVRGVLTCFLFNNGNSLQHNGTIPLA